MKDRSVSFDPNVRAIGNGVLHPDLAPRPRSEPARTVRRTTAAPAVSPSPASATRPTTDQVVLSPEAATAHLSARQEAYSALDAAFSTATAALGDEALTRSETLFVVGDLRAAVARILDAERNRLGEVLAKGRTLLSQATISAQPEAAEAVSSLAILEGAAQGHLELVRATLPNLLGGIDAMRSVLVRWGTPTGRPGAAEPGHPDGPSGSGPASPAALAAALVAKLDPRNEPVRTVVVSALDLDPRDAEPGAGPAGMTADLGAQSPGETTEISEEVLIRRAIAGALRLGAQARRLEAATTEDSRASQGTSTRPDLVSVLAAVRAPSSGATVTVLAVAEAGRLTADDAFPAGHRFVGADTLDLTIGEVVTRVEPGPAPTLADIVTALNASGAPVVAATQDGGDGRQRLVLTASATGRDTDVALRVGGDDGSAPGVLGRFTRTSAASDTVLLVERGSSAPALVRSPARTVAGVLPGATLTVVGANPSARVRVGVNGSSDEIADALAELVAAAGCLLRYCWAVTAPAGALPGDRDLGTLAGGVLAAFRTGGTAIPGAHLTAEGLSFERGEFTPAYAVGPAALDAQLRGAAAALAAVCRAATDPGVGALVVRLDAECAYTRRTRQVTADSRLVSVAARLTSQEMWLRGATARQPG